MWLSCEDDGEDDGEEDGEDDGEEDAISPRVEVNVVGSRSKNGWSG